MSLAPFAIWRGGWSTSPDPPGRRDWDKMWTRANPGRRAGSCSALRGAGLLRWGSWCDFRESHLPCGGLGLFLCVCTTVLLLGSDQMVRPASCGVRGQGGLLSPASPPVLSARSQLLPPSPCAFRDLLRRPRGLLTPRPLCVFSARFGLPACSSSL